MNTFQFNDFYSRDIGLIVKNLPDFGKAEKNIDIVEVPGRPGTLHYDYETHKAYKTEFDCYCRYDQLAQLYTAVNGNGKLIFNDDSIYHDVYIYGKIKEEYFSHDIAEINIPLEVQPYATDIQESTATITKDTLFIYNGDVKVFPHIEISGTRRHHIVIGDDSFAVDCGKGTVHIDCDNMYILHDNGEIANECFEGTIPHLIPGEQMIINDEAEIKMRWRNKWMR